MLTSIVSPEERIKGIDSFQSSCACLAASVSYRIEIFLVFDGFFLLKYELNSGYFLRQLQKLH